MVERGGACGHKRGHVPRRRLPAPSFAVLSLLLVAGCVGQPKTPPAPPPVLVPLPPPPAPVARGTDWRDWPQTPGDWHYAREGAGSVARFGRPGAAVLTLTCDPAARQVRLARTGAPGPVTIRTSSMARTLSLTAAGAVLAASDPLLDAMGYSRGRFVIEQAGTAPLVVPAWPEVLRVAEDCRAAR